MKNVIDTAAAQSLTVHVILNDKGHLAGKVLAHYSKSGVVRVDVWEAGKGIIHQGRAGGYGYDKFTAALRGAVFAGIKLHNHCGEDEKTKGILARYKKAKRSKRNENRYKAEAAKIGARFANWTNEDGFRSLYYEDGLTILAYYGYTVFQAL